MKGHYIFSALLGIGLLLQGCETLDYTPADQLNDKTFWRTEQHANQAAVALYAAMKAGWAFGRDFTFDMISDIADGTSPHAGIARGTSFSSGDASVQNTWQYLYEVVHRSNTVIRNVSAMDIDETVKTRVIGEAKFLRAMAYFRMLNCWGGVPYYDESCIIEEEFATLSNPRESAETIRGHILDDLTDAISKLPVAWETSDYGRATKGAAYALRGKVYLYNREWSKAIADFEEIVYNKSNNYGYALDDDYARVFKLYNGAKSPETVFSIQNKSGVGTEYGMQIQALMGCRGAYGSCWNNTVPSTQLVDMYEFKDGRPFNWDEIFPGYNAMTPEQRKELLSVEMDGSGTIVGLREADTAKILSAYTCRDPRLMATVIVPYSHYMGNIGRTTNVDLIFALDHNLAGNANGGTIQNNAGWVSYLYRKFVTEGDQGGAISNRLHTPFAFPLIRFADVLLMLSEAYNEAGQLDKAVTEFNKVRARVGMPGLNSGPAWMVVSNKEQMAERIRKERAVEFAGEGLRFSDLRRWGYEIAHKTLNNVDAVNIYGEPIYTHLFTERDMLWPIPGVERERNKELTQNPGW